MDDAISVADADRRVWPPLRRVRQSRSIIVVTSHGKPIARIVPLGERDDRGAKGGRPAGRLAGLSSPFLSNHSSFAQNFSQGSR